MPPWIRIKCRAVALFCRLLEHDFEVVETYDRYTRKLHCRRCGQYFAMSDRYQTLLPWSDEFERLTRFFYNLPRPKL
jgi:hypothetical protein